MNLQDSLAAYSEWLDGKGLMNGDVESETSHDQLVEQFVSWWRDPPVRRAPLVGDVRESLKGATIRELIDELAGRTLVADELGEDWPSLTGEGE